MLKNAHPPGQSSPLQNRLLKALPRAEYERLLPHLQLVAMPLGASVYQAGVQSRFIYFPVDCIVSLLHETETGASAGIAIVGNDGLVGIALFMGGQSTPSCAVVHAAGRAYRLPGDVLKRAFEHGGPLQHLFLRYTQALITQMAQTAVCNRHHSVEQQLCRLILLSLDLVPGVQLRMTQERISTLLGVRRVGVTQAAVKLQKQGLIQYTRGRITVLERAGLEAQVCECYGLVKREAQRLLPDQTAT